MTRETKISLLIGLAFIIVIGMLLADYSSNSNQPPRVPLLDLKETVLDSTATPSRQQPGQSQCQRRRAQSPGRHRGRQPGSHAPGHRPLSRARTPRRPHAGR